MDDDITSPDIRSDHPFKPIQTSIHHYDNKLAQAFHLDCEKLLQQFQEKQNLSFIAFSKLWKEMCFLAIFKGLENILGIQVFLENCFTITKKFLYSSNLYLQTGALYVLYGLYYKQPIKEWVKIRLTHADVEKLEEIIDIHKSSQLLDPVFIFAKMRIDRAFQHVAIPQALGMELQHSKRLDVAADLSGDNASTKLGDKGVLNRFKNLMEADPDLVEFEETNEEYQKLAQKYKDRLFVFPSAIGEHLKDTYSQLFDISLEDKMASPTELDHVSLDDKGESRASFYHVSAMKKKAASNNNAIYRGERKVLTAMDLDLDLGKPSTSK